METIVNTHHIGVRKMCGSCRHRDIDNEGNRICTKMQLMVQQLFCCEQWQMSEGLMNAGRSGGVIKKLTEIIIR